MFKKIREKLKRLWDLLQGTYLIPEEITPVAEEKNNSIFAGDSLLNTSHRPSLEQILKSSLQITAKHFRSVQTGAAMDDSGDLKTATQLNLQNVSYVQLLWYAEQGFIGYSLCAVIAQNWLVDKACTMPAEDAIRKGYELTLNDGKEQSLELLDKIRKTDIQFRVMKNLSEFIRWGRVFGIRIAMFVVESNDSEYYEKPFNIDSITAGSYKGISQIDPYWITPELDAEAAGEPSSMYFYEPTWWRVTGRRIHRTHLVIMRHKEVSDLLKPTYQFGGISIPQQIFNRVYMSEKTANEAPQLALTKRSTILGVDIANAVANQGKFEEKMRTWAYYRDNYGVKIIDREDVAQQFDTSLADLDAAIMTQFQLVASIAEVPSTKLLGTSPKGFQSTGEYEETNYHEKLESLQTINLTPLLERHYALVLRSEFSTDLPVTIRWTPLDSLTEKELAEINQLKAATGVQLVTAGAIAPEEERKRVINDLASGYDGLDEELEGQYDEEEIDDAEAESAATNPTFSIEGNAPQL